MLLFQSRSDVIFGEFEYLTGRARGQSYSSQRQRRLVRAEPAPKIHEAIVKKGRGDFGFGLASEPINRLPAAAVRLALADGEQKVEVDERTVQRVFDTDARTAIGQVAV